MTVTSGWMSPNCTKFGDRRGSPGSSLDKVGSNPASGSLVTWNFVGTIGGIGSECAVATGQREAAPADPDALAGQPEEALGGGLVCGESIR